MDAGPRAQTRWGGSVGAVPEAYLANPLLCEADDGGLREFQQSIRPQLRTDPGLFGATERDVRPQVRMMIDPHRAAFEPSGDGDGAIAIGTPDRTAQAVDGVVYLRESIVDVRSEEHTSELQSLMRISYAVFCLKKKTT